MAIGYSLRVGGDLKNKTLLIIAIIFGLISALLVYNYLSDIEATQQTRLVDVVVANVKYLLIHK